MSIALTIRQPWAWAVVAGHKDVENRSWPTNYRGTLYIHAAKRHEAHADDVLALDHGLRLPPSLVYGALIGTVEIVDCVRDSDSEWARRGMYHWVLRRPHRLVHPIPCRGHRGLFHPERSRP